MLYELGNKHTNMDNILESLNEVNMIESNRVLQINNMEYQYTKTIDDDKRKMDRIIDERRIICSNHETDTQTILFNLLNHLREIKILNMELERFHSKREKYMRKQEELGKAYDRRELNLNRLVELGILMEMKNYFNELEASTTGNGITDD